MNIPNQWQQGFGESSEKYYDKWFYHKDDEYEVHVWWDKGGPHNVELIPINRYDENDDPIRGYAKEVDSFPTEDEAIEYACDLMEKYA